MCGIFGAFNCEQAAKVTFLGLHFQQHRAKESAGVVSTDGFNLFRRTGHGLAQDVFPDQRSLEPLLGRSAIGHIRYSTVSDDPKLDNTQPVLGSSQNRAVAVAHNGNLVNHQALRRQLAASGPFKTSMDTEVILRLFCSSNAAEVAERVFDAVRPLRGAFSLVFLDNDAMVAVRDPWGFRPLVLGRRGGSWFVSSETTPFDSVGIETVREIEPGEILVITKAGVQSWYFDEERLSLCPLPHQRAHCIFELLYFAHPAGFMFGQEVVRWRQRCGRVLCHHCPSSATAVADVPDSALFHADGFAQAQPGGRRVRALLRNHYIGRTFIEPDQSLRLEAVSRKFTPVPAEVKGKRLTVVEDSIVRLTTLPGVVTILRQAGAVEVHGRIAAPPIKYPCLYGIDTPTRAELAAANMTEEQIRQKAGLDSLGYMPMEGLRSLVDLPDDFCYACMTGEYPIDDQD